MTSTSRINQRIHMYTPPRIMPPSWLNIGTT